MLIPILLKYLDKLTVFSKIDIMQYGNLNIHFINQFRQEKLVYACTRAQRYKHFIFWQFAGSKNETGCLGQKFSEKISNVEIITKLVNKLENEDRHASLQVSDFLKNLQAKVSLYALWKFNRPHHYRTLLGILKQLLLLVITFRQAGQQQLLTKLKSLLSIESNHNGIQPPGSDEVEGLIKIMEQYVDEMYRYYSHLNTLLLKESNDPKGISAITHMEKYLLRLIFFIETLICTTRSTQLLLESWKKQIFSSELQEIYN